MTDGVKLFAGSHRRLKQICGESQPSCARVSASMKQLSHERPLHRLRARRAQAAAVPWQQPRGWGLQQNCPHCSNMFALLMSTEPSVSCGS